MTTLTAPRVARVLVAVLALAMIPVAWATQPDPVTLSFYYSPDAEGVLEAAIDAFNEEHEGEIEVIGEDESSGSVESKIAGGELQPEMWMPAASTWARLLEFDMEIDPVPAENPSFFYSPEVFATWEKVDERVTAEFGEMGWGTLAELNDEDGLQGEGGPLGDVSPFRFGHTRPTTSTSGLYAMVSEYAAALDVAPDQLKASDPMRDEGIVEQVRDFELSVRNYGDVADDFCEPLSAYAQQNYSVLYMQETTLQGCRAKEGVSLKEVYPAEGSFVADYPLIVLDAGWVTPEEGAAAGIFRSWFGQNLDEETVLDEYLRVGSPWDTRADTAPAVTEGVQGTLRILPVPPTDVLAQARQSWSSRIRKVGHVVMLLEHSGEMATDDRWSTASQMLLSLVDELDPRDHAGLVLFDSGVEVRVAPGRVEDVEVELNEALDPEIGPASTSTAELSDGVMKGTHLRAILEQDAIDILLVVSTGQDDSDAEVKGAASDWIRQRANFRSPIQVFTVFMGDPNGDGDEQLASLAEDGRGTAWSLTGPDAVTPQDVVEKISSLVPVSA